MIKKTVISVLIAFLISFSLLYIFLFMQHYKIDVNGISETEDQLYLEKKMFYHQNFTAEKKIFLLGSSHIDSLNSTLIQNQLQSNGFTFQVYNLAEASDRPVDRLKELDMITLAKPTIVVYGVAIRDFENIYPINESPDNIPTKFLPDPSTISQKIVKSTSDFFNLDFMQNPKIDTLSSIRDFMNSHNIHTEQVNYESDPNLFFMKIIEDNHLRKSKMDLEQLRASLPPFNGIDPPQSNENAIALKKIIEVLHNNGIKVIIFTTPQHKYFLDAVPDSEEKSFKQILNYLKDQQNVPVFSLQDNYTNMDDWSDLTHLAINKDSSFYSKDIVKMILSEIGS